MLDRLSDGKSLDRRGGGRGKQGTNLTHTNKSETTICSVLAVLACNVQKVNAENQKIQHSGPRGLTRLQVLSIDGYRWPIYPQIVCTARYPRKPPLAVETRPGHARTHLAEEGTPCARQRVRPLNPDLASYSRSSSPAASTSPSTLYKDSHSSSSTLTVPMFLRSVLFTNVLRIFVFHLPRRP